jgi:hypothetical protein
MNRFSFLYILFLTVISGYTLHAQSFAPVGAYWCYTGSSSILTAEPLETAKWTDTVRSEKDTIVNGVACRKLSAYRRELRLNFTDTFRTTANYYVYDNTDTVFIYSPFHEDFVPLYIFNLGSGDTLCLPIPFPEFAANITEYCFTIDSVVTQNINSFPLKSVYTRTIVANGDSVSVGFGKYDHDWGNPGKYTELVGGGMVNFPAFGLLPTATLYSPDGLGHPRKIAGLPNGQLSRYTDVQHQLSLAQNNCDFIGAGTVSIEDVSLLKGITVYPNPVKGVFFISSEEPFYRNYQLKIFDHLGRTVISDQVPKGGTKIKLDIGSIAPGMYILELRGTDSQYRQKLSIR